MLSRLWNALNFAAGLDYSVTQNGGTVSVHVCQLLFFRPVIPCHICKLSFKSHTFCASIQTRNCPTAADLAPPLPFEVCKGVGSPCKEANDLKSCSSWERKKPFWKAASTAMAGAMHQAKEDRIVVAVRKELTGDRSIFNSILYSLEWPRGSR